MTAAARGRSLIPVPLPSRALPAGSARGDLSFRLSSSPAPSSAILRGREGPLAQLGERRLDKAEVAGSSPARPIESNPQNDADSDHSTSPRRGCRETPAGRFPAKPPAKPCDCDAIAGNRDRRRGRRPGPRGAGPAPSGGGLDRRPGGGASIQALARVGVCPHPPAQRRVDRLGSTAPAAVRSARRRRRAANLGGRDRRAGRVAVGVRVVTRDRSEHANIACPMAPRRMRRASRCSVRTACQGRVMMLADLDLLLTTDGRDLDVRTAEAIRRPGRCA